MHHLVTIIPKPVPSMVRPSHERRTTQLQELWATYIQSPEAADGDYEDFYEQAARLKAAIAGFGVENIWLHLGRPHETSARNLETGEVRPVGELAHLPKYGLQEGRPGHHIELPQAHLAGKYAMYQAFQDRAGRRSVIAGYATKDEQDLRDVLWNMYTEGVRDFFVKTTTSKLGLWRFSASEGLNAEQLEQILLDQDDWIITRREGDRNSLQVQESVTMTYEYRLFVVNGEAVTGAGCIEEFTPLDSDGAAFSPYMRRNRNSDDYVENAPDTLIEILDFASETVAALSAEVPDLLSYTLDVAIGADGKPLVIEFNSLLNSGLYASNPTLVTRALARMTINH